MMILDPSRQYRATYEGLKGKLFFDQDWQFKSDDFRQFHVKAAEIESMTDWIALANYSDMQELQGKKIEFSCVCKRGKFIGRLTSYGRTNFTIELSRDSNQETRCWNAGDVMTFTIDMCYELKEWDVKSEPAPKPYRRPQTRTYIRKDKVDRSEAPIKMPTKAQENISWDSYPRKRAYVRTAFTHTFDQHGALNVFVYNGNVHIDYGKMRVKTSAVTVADKTLREWVALAIELNPKRKVV